MWISIDLGNILDYESFSHSLVYCEFKQHKPWFDEKCSELLDQRKHDTLKLLQNPSQTNEENMNDVRRETNRTFREKGRNIGKKKLMCLKQSVKIKVSDTYYVGIHKFMIDYQTRTNLMKDEDS
jgi:hypothetical protein